MPRTVGRMGYITDGMIVADGIGDFPIFASGLEEISVWANGPRQSKETDIAPRRPFYIHCGVHHHGACDAVPNMWSQVSTMPTNHMQTITWHAHTANVFRRGSRVFLGWKWVVGGGLWPCTLHATLIFHYLRHPLCMRQSIDLIMLRIPLSNGGWDTGRREMLLLPAGINLAAMIAYALKVHQS